MKDLQRDVLFKVIESVHLKSKEVIILRLEPISPTDYKQLATTKLSDRKTDRITRIFLKSVFLSDVSEMPSLVGKIVKGTIVEFSRKDHSKFIILQKEYPSL